MRFLRWTLILLQFAWLNVVMPGHTRGMVTMDGTRADGSESHCCQSDRSSEDHGKPSDEDRASCAVCFFAARMTVPDVVDLTPPPLGLVETVTVGVEQSVDDLPYLATYDGRAPPGV